MVDPTLDAALDEAVDLEDVPRGRSESLRSWMPIFTAEFISEVNEGLYEGVKS